MPSILRPWVSMFRATPKVCIPGTDVDVAFSLRWTAVFSVLRLFMRKVLYWFGWPVGEADTYFAAACLASFCHAVMILPALAAVLWSRPYVPTEKMQPSPKWYSDATNALMGFCTGYMIYDSVMGYVVETWQPGIGPVLSPDDITYLGHHVLVTLYMTSSQWKKAGHMSAMMLMFNGEFTAPVLNVHLFLEKAMAQECCKGIAWLPALFAYNEQLFSLLYIICRVAVSPFVIAHISYKLLFTKKGRADVPLWLSICWMPMCWGVQFGSIPWIMTCIETLKRGPVIGHDEL